MAVGHCNAEEIGLLSSRLLAVHMTQLEPVEIERLVQTGVHVIHCPGPTLSWLAGFARSLNWMLRG